MQDVRILQDCKNFAGTFTVLPETLENHRNWCRLYALKSIFYFFLFRNGYESRSISDYFVCVCILLQRSMSLECQAQAVRGAPYPLWTCYVLVWMLLAGWRSRAIISLLLDNIIIWKWAFVCTCLHAVETETVLLWQITQRHQGASVKLGTGQPSQAMIYLLLLYVCTCSKLQTDWRLCGNQMRKLYDLIE